MNILVYGAGNIGCLYAALLQVSGQEVTLLARGDRAKELRQHGIRLQNATTHEQSTTQVTILETLPTDEFFDLVLVVLPKNHLTEVVAILAQHQHSPNIMLFGNSSAGFQDMAEELGPERLLLGFPGAAGVPHEGRIRYLITSPQEQPTTLGEFLPSKTDRLELFAEVFANAGFPVSTCEDMQAWLITHVAKISPTVNALYAADCDLPRLVRTRDALVLMVRALKEGYEVLEAAGIPITPSHQKVFAWLPEPVTVFLCQKMLASEAAAIKVGHAAHARIEMRILAEEFRDIAESTSVSTPAIDRLRTYLDPELEPLADGSRQLPLNWSGLWVLLVSLAVLLTWLVWSL